MKIAHIACVALACLSMAGCANLNAVNYTRDFTKGRSAVMDSDQRVIVTNGRTVTNAQGGQTAVVCAEPSPDTFTLLAASASGRLSSAGRSALEGAFAQSESGASIGIRTPSIQLLRDGMYRLCEAYMDGAIGQLGYASGMRRYQVMMSALLAVEQLTGPVRAPAVSIRGGEASAQQYASVVDALDRVQKSIADETRKATLVDSEISALRAQLAAATDPKTKAEIQAAIDKQEAEKAALAASIEESKKTLVEARRHLTALTQSASANSAVGAIETVTASRPDSASIIAVTSAVKEIILAAMSDDQTPQFCLDYLVLRAQSVTPSGQRSQATLDNAIGKADTVCAAILGHAAQQITMH